MVTETVTRDSVDYTTTYTYDNDGSLLYVTDRDDRKEKGERKGVRLLLRKEKGSGYFCVPSAKSSLTPCPAARQPSGAKKVPDTFSPSDSSFAGKQVTGGNIPWPKLNASQEVYHLSHEIGSGYVLGREKC